MDVGSLASLLGALVYCIERVQDKARAPMLSLLSVYTEAKGERVSDSPLPRKLTRADWECRSCNVQGEHSQSLSSALRSAARSGRPSARAPDGTYWFWFMLGDPRFSWFSLVTKFLLRLLMICRASYRLTRGRLASRRNSRNYMRTVVA